MSEILNIGFGQAGCAIAAEHVRIAANEHSVLPDGSLSKRVDQKLEHINVLFDEKQENRYFPRTLLVDLDPMGIDAIYSNPYSSLIHSDLTLCGNISGGNNFAQATYGEEGQDLAQRVRERIRKMVEGCDSFGGFQLSHATSGGTGSGLYRNALSTLREEYVKHIDSSFSIYPDVQPDNVLGTYNTVLAIHSQVENSYLVNAFDNDNTLRQSKGKFNGLHDHDHTIVNTIIAKCQSAQSCSVRFPGLLNFSLRKQCVNLIPFPRLHFMTVAYQTMSGHKSMSHLIDELYKSPLIQLNQLSDLRNLSVFAQFRGAGVSTYEVESYLKTIRMENPSNFVEWISNNNTVSYCNATSDATISQEGYMVRNDFHISGLWQRLTSQFTAMFRRKAFIHCYCQYGMDEMEFTEAESNLNDLASEYVPQMGANEEDEEFEDYQWAEY